MKTEDLDAHMLAMIKWAEELNTKAKSNIEKAQAKQKQQFDAKHKPPTFQVGDKVWVYNSRKDTRQGGKLEWNWNGPFEIAEHTSRGTYCLRNQHGKLLKQTISSNRLKLYTGARCSSQEQDKEKQENEPKGTPNPPPKRRGKANPALDCPPPKKRKVILHLN